MMITVNGTPATNAYSSSTSSPSATMPSGITSGELLITNLVANGGSGLSITPPSGWTLLERANNGTSTLVVAAYWRIADGSEGGSATYTLGTAQVCSLQTFRISGHDATTHFDVAESNNSGSGTTLTATGITTVTNAAMALVFYGVESGSNIPSLPSGWTAVTDGNSSSRGWRIASLIKTTAGAVGDTTSTQGSSRNWAAIMAAVRPGIANPSITVSPDAAIAGAAIVAPTVIRGSISLAPAASTSAAAVVAPTVARGSISITPGAAASVAAVVAPDVVISGGGETYRAFPSESGPSNEHTDDGSGDGVSLGMEFSVSSDCNVIALHYWKAADVTNPQSRSGAIYAVGGSVLTGTAVTFTDSGSGWQTATLPAPIALTPSTLYRIVVFYPYDAGDNLGYSKTPNYFSSGAGASGITNGPLTVYNDGASTDGQDTYNYGASISNPANTFEATNYWVDLTVQTPGGGETVTPDAAIAGAGVVAPVVIRGSLSIAPAAATSAAAIVAPSVVIGSLSITPAPAEAGAAIVAPSVALSSLSIAPAAAVSVAAGVAPDVVIGSLVIAPDAATAGAESVSPSVILGALSIAPAAAASVATVVNPDVETGALTITPAPATSTAAIVAPSVALGSLVIAPDSADASAEVVNPDVEGGGFTYTPAPAIAGAASVAPAIALSSLAIAPDAAESVAAIVAPGVVLGALAIAPAPAASVATVIQPEIPTNGIIVTPAPATAGATIGVLIVIIAGGSTPYPTGGNARGSGVGARSSASVGARASVNVSARSGSRVGSRRRSY